MGDLSALELLILAGCIVAALWLVLMAGWA